MAFLYSYLIKINIKTSENHKKGSKYLSSFCFCNYRSDFLSVLYFASGCGNYSVGILVGQDNSKVYDAGNLWKSAVVITLGFV